MSERKLTTKQRLFVEAYLTNANGREAARKAGYKGNDKQLGVIAAQNLTKLSISALLEKRVETAIITADEVLTNVREIALTAERDADKLKAYEMLGKHLQIWTEGGTTINIEIGTRVILPEQSEPPRVKQVVGNKRLQLVS